jgi:hypothetical protein
MATIAAFLALGGVGYAAATLPANSVGAKQLRQGAVTGAKVKDGSLGGADIDASSLGTVPDATRSAIAGRAASADEATRADTAGTATSAAHATTAGDAQTLDGMTLAQIAADLEPTCPAGTELESDLCFEAEARPPSYLFTARSVCTAAGGWLPDPEQIIQFQKNHYATPQPAEWSDVVFREGKDEWGYVAHTEATGSGTAFRIGETPTAYRCVLAPTT